MSTRSTRRFRIKVRVLFPPNDPIAPCLLRLMAAANDLGTLAKLCRQSGSRMPQTESEKSIVAAENVYLFRLAGATLYEAARAFQDFETELKAAGLFQKMKQLDLAGRAAFGELENAFRQGFEKTDFGKVLVQFRHHVFHYDKPESFSKALNGHGEIGELIIGEIPGVSRHLLADDLQVWINLRPTGTDLNVPEPRMKATEFMRTVAELAYALQVVVDAWINFHLTLRPGAIVEEVREEVETERLWRINDPGVLSP
jgi:hypothetical protein